MSFPLLHGNNVYYSKQTIAVVPEDLCVAYAVEANLCATYELCPTFIRELL